MWPQYLTSCALAAAEKRRSLSLFPCENTDDNVSVLQLAAEKCNCCRLQTCGEGLFLAVSILLVFAGN